GARRHARRGRADHGRGGERYRPRQAERLEAEAPGKRRDPGASRDAGYSGIDPEGVSEEADRRVRHRDRGRRAGRHGEAQAKGARPHRDQQPAQAGLCVRLGPERSDPARPLGGGRAPGAALQARRGARDPASRRARSGDRCRAVSDRREDLPDDLGTLARLVSECRKCRLCETRTNTVFADGSVKAKLLLIGEAPGRDEDLKGLPFVGRAGQLLDKMIAAIQLRRDEVYICNVLKCRPPENRTPLQDEVDQCMPYLEQQLALVRPALICALGLSAVQALLKTKSSMASLRGRTFEYKGIPLIPTYHPAALLRNPGLKREAWEDLQRVRDTLKAQGAS